MTESDMGRYDGEGGGSEGYMPVNLQDYGQGGEDTEQRLGEADEKQYRKAYDIIGKKPIVLKKGDKFNITDHAGIIRKAEIITDTATVRKAKVYINSPTEAPKGRTVKRGLRGGYYYITSERKPAHPKSGAASKPIRGKPKSRHGWSVKERKKEEADDWEEPEIPDVSGADRYMVVEGDGVSVYFMEIDGEVKCEAMQNPESKEFLDTVSNCFQSNDEDIFSCVRRIAKEGGLIVKVG